MINRYCHARLSVEQLYRTAFVVDSRSTSIVSANIGTFVGCDPTIRFDCNLIDYVLSCKPLSFPVHVIERFISSLMLLLVIQGFFVMTIYHLSEHSNFFRIHIHDHGWFSFN